jgi:hypothetical protein
MKIRPVVAECGRTDVQTDVTKLIVVFRNSAHAPKNANKNNLSVIMYKRRGSVRIRVLTSVAYNQAQVEWVLLLLEQWYSTFFVRVPPDIISLQLCTPKVVGA